MSSERLIPRSGAVQERSRQRRQQLLDAAQDMIAEVGLDGLSMRQVGRRAGLPVASVYHYFPAAAALVRALALRQLSRIGDIVQDTLASEPGASYAETIEELVAIAHVVVERVAAHLVATPAASAIWNALRSNPDLRALDRADTLANARHVAGLLGRVLRDVPSQRIEAFATVLLEAVAVNMMFAIEADPPSRAIHLDALHLLVSSALRGLPSMSSDGGVRRPVLPTAGGSALVQERLAPWSISTG